MGELQKLVKKYSVQGPRYTSYPTAPQWNESTGESAYRRDLIALGRRVNEGDELALYVHLPFCESLCYYCACNIQITHDKSRSKSYLVALERELSEVRNLLGEKYPLSQISWGGGTPTFLSVDEIRKLYAAICSAFEISTNAEVAIEVDPRVTSDEQLVVLSELGFNRISLGVQDFNPKVQKTVHREQSIEMTEAMLNRARGLGFEGVNFDFIYGLPYQTLESFRETVDTITRIRPDRIALYNYARVPDLRSHQAILEKHPMPDADDRIAIFTMAYDQLIAAGYVAIGMDHFALPKDEMALALGQGSLSRNFMGYTVKKSANMIGIGASAIGELDTGYYQNIRNAKEYEGQIAKTGLAAFRGCELNSDDQRRKWAIQNIMCQFEIPLKEYQTLFGGEFWQDFDIERPFLSEFEREGMIEVEPNAFRVTDQGRLFVRNIAMVFDAYLKKDSAIRFSATV